MWNGKQVSVILMTYQEKNSIKAVIEGFEATGVVDEILVINNNAEPGTWEEVAETSARQVLETRQGYGWATRRGLEEATGDLMVLVEPDGTFLPRDVVKLLVYSDDCDAVFGTRTTRELIWRGANMGFALKWGNWGVGQAGGGARDPGEVELDHELLVESLQPIQICLGSAARLLRVDNLGLQS